jgi:hypothetical protein
MFKDGRTNVHEEERSGRPSVVGDGLVQSVDQKICESQRLTISELLCEYPHVSHTVLYEIITDRLGQCCPTFLYIGAHLTDGCGGAGAVWRLHKNNNNNNTKVILIKIIRFYFL